jgi:orotidine-5'-phosphate decarboxylase
MKDIPVNERIILALDVDSPEQAKELVKKTESHLNFYKVGLQPWLNSTTGELPLQRSMAMTLL